ncbi:hypothetical protein QBC34DRAFT_427803 [Podospora aff. communis PSN243]|uniref:Tat pathway signal sequence n=1 Tax=Podospora aff. communis PSN243 TaxID=3040156 RepID=A0AAV9GJ37_9PEZI|nr:hypothetical protein QBC34DRAFT_427803 [Podospora aff. communis PSN243]
MAPRVTDGYRPLPNTSREVLDEGLDRVPPKAHCAWNSKAILRALLALSFLNFIAVSTLLTIHTSVRERGMNHDIRRTSSFSPIFDLVDMRLAPATFNGALRDNTSIWRMPPSPEVDAAWDRISAEDMQIITVSAEDVRRSGKDPSLSIKAPESWGLGSDAYIAQVEVFHQIHCLNELRNEMYPDYYHISHPTELHLAHRAHCIHMLLQALMCNADVGIITHNWVHDERYSEPKTRAFPDFGVHKMCRNFDAVMGWLREKGGVRDFASKFLMKYPPGAPVVQGEGYATSE